MSDDEMGANAQDLIKEVEQENKKKKKKVLVSIKIIAFPNLNVIMIYQKRIKTKCYQKKIQ